MSEQASQALSGKKVQTVGPAYAKLLSLLKQNNRDMFFIHSVTHYAESLLRALEDGVPFTTPGVVPLSFADSICPQCGGDTHNADGIHMSCGACGWTEGGEGHDG